MIARSIATHWMLLCASRAHLSPFFKRSLPQRGPRLRDLCKQLRASDSDEIYPPNLLQNRPVSLLQHAENVFKKRHREHVMEQLHVKDQIFSPASGHCATCRSVHSNSYR